MMRTIARSSPRLRPAALLGSRFAAGERTSNTSYAAAVAATAAGLILAATSVDGYVPPSLSAADHKHRLEHTFIGRIASSSVPMTRRDSVALCESSKSASSSSAKEVLFDPSHDYYERVHPPDRSQTESHAIFGPLLGEGRIERYNFYRRIHAGKASLRSNHNADESAEPVEVAVGDVQLGNKVNGHRGIVHGGIISLIFDDAMGWGYEALLMSDPALDDGTKIVTANLNIDYRAPLTEESRAAVRVYYVRSEGRKLYFRARLESHDGTILYAEATSLFVKLRKEN